MCGRLGERAFEVRALLTAACPGGVSPCPNARVRGDLRRFGSRGVHSKPAAAAGPVFPPARSVARTESRSASARTLRSWERGWSSAPVGHDVPAHSRRHSSAQASPRTPRRGCGRVASGLGGDRRRARSHGLEIVVREHRSALVQRGRRPHGKAVDAIRSESGQRLGARAGGPAETLAAPRSRRHSKPRGAPRRPTRRAALAAGPARCRSARGPVRSRSSWSRCAAVLRPHRGLDREVYVHPAPPDVVAAGGAGARRTQIGRAEGHARRHPRGRRPVGRALCRGCGGRSSWRAAR